MCTVIISSRDTGNIPLLVGANRDERVSRPSSHFELREKNRALYPLDVGGGTWIGVNNSGLFVAITNIDNDKHIPGRESRGMLVKMALRAQSLREVSEWADLLVPKRYNGFRLIVADMLSCVIWMGDGLSDVVTRTVLPPGLHVISGFGVDTWDVPRCSTIKKALSGDFGLQEMQQILSHHATGKVDDDVCVHDPDETHVTVSSCIIQATSDWGFKVDAVKTAPCLSTPWDYWELPRG